MAISITFKFFITFRPITRASSNHEEENNGAWPFLALTCCLSNLINKVVLACLSGQKCSLKVIEIATSANPFSIYHSKHIPFSLEREATVGEKYLQFGAARAEYTPCVFDLHGSSC